MKYIKSFLVIAIIASVTGFVVWHLMWMTGIEKKFKEEQSSGMTNKVEVRERKSEGQKGETENKRPVAEEEAMSVKESRTQMIQTGATLQETKMQGGSKADGGAKLPVEETKTESVKEDGKWSEKDFGLGNKKQEAISAPGQTTTEMPNDKTMSIKITNKANPAIQKNPPQPQPIKRPEAKVAGVRPYPTSTPP